MSIELIHTNFSSMHVYVISVVIYTTVLSQMSKSSSIRPQCSGHLKKKVDEDELSDVDGEPSPINDSDADGDYVQPLEEEEASEVSNQDPQDHDLQSLLSNKSIPEKQRELIQKLLLERREQVRRKTTKEKCPQSRKSPPKSKWFRRWRARRSRRNKASAEKNVNWKVPKIQHLNVQRPK